MLMIGVIINVIDIFLVFLITTIVLFKLLILHHIFICAHIPLILMLWTWPDRLLPCSNQIRIYSTINLSVILLGHSLHLFLLLIHKVAFSLFEQILTFLNKIVILWTQLFLTFFLSFDCDVINL